jgi:hypothetical protein
MTIAVYLTSLSTTGNLILHPIYLVDVSEVFVS